MMPRVVLASASAIRADILRRAGVSFAVVPATVDEDEVKTAFRREGRNASDCVRALAGVKAVQVSKRHQSDLVIGADQMLVCEDRWFDKPCDVADARAQLVSLRGRYHELISAVCVARDGWVMWEHVEHPALTMRDFSEEFIAVYLERGGDSLLASVGAYRLEGEGIQLFSKIEGDYFAILGLPLLPLLDFLRGHGVLPR